VSRRREPAVLLGALAICLALSAVGARDLFTWLLEVAPIFIGVPIRRSPAKARIPGGP